jgi:23S rRNA (cytidine1920-2'-O)/16S rRNA (cytidine1409-2'-O)-methyltransferase
MSQHPKTSVGTGGSSGDAPIFPPPAKERLDAALASRGLCDSREQGKRLILAGEVLVNGHPAVKPGQIVKLDDIVIVKERPKYVSRGGLKLEGALASFGIDPSGLICLDAGSSTGGFTDCLLQHGAAKVYAFDVGTNQLVWKIRNDPRVTAREQFNLRHLQPGDVPEPVDLAVFDLSFISLTLILPAVMAVLRPGSGQIVCLIKPQFELRREDIGQGGIVRDPALHQQAVDRIRTFVENTPGFHWRGCIPSPIKGTDGNTEFLAWITHAPVSPSATEATA